MVIRMVRSLKQTIGSPLASRKATIPKALREQVWCAKFGKVYAHKCSTRWCSNIVTVFDFQIGHDIPESKGGSLEITNLLPLCSRCNSSMSNTYSFKEWERISAPTTGWFARLFRSTVPITSRVRSSAGWKRRAPTSLSQVPMNLCSLNEDFGNRNKRFLVSFRSSFNWS
jgi:5-methylcytosine-specific restriction endonuclease McrA